MRVVVQRVRSASVSVDGQATGTIGSGLLLFVGIGKEDDAETVTRVARKCAEMRIFPDEAGRFDRSLIEWGGAALVVSQFTLLADIRKGRRPAFTRAADPELAAGLLDVFVDALRGMGIEVQTGRFGAKMLVESVNDGPVTIVVDSADLELPRR